jgi:hypothetical protein
MAVGNLGAVYVAGDTYSSLDGPIVGVSDAFVAKMAGVPEPCSAALAMMVVVIMGATQRKVFTRR